MTGQPIDSPLSYCEELDAHLDAGGSVQPQIVYDLIETVRRLKRQRDDNRREAQENNERVHRQADAIRAELQASGHDWQDDDVSRLVDKTIDLERKRNEALHAEIARLRGEAPQEPEDWTPYYDVVPDRLTAENGMKDALTGKFFEKASVMYANGQHDDLRVPVSWPTIKAIHAAVVRHSVRWAPKRVP